MTGTSHFSRNGAFFYETACVVTAASHQPLIDNIQRPTLPRASRSPHLYPFIHITMNESVISTAGPTKQDLNLSNKLEQTLRKFDMFETVEGSRARLCLQMFIFFLLYISYIVWYVNEWMKEQVTQNTLASFGYYDKYLNFCRLGLIWVLPLDEVIASRALFVIISGSGGRAEMLLEPAQ